MDFQNVHTVPNGQPISNDAMSIQIQPDTGHIRFVWVQDHPAGLLGCNDDFRTRGVYQPQHNILSVVSRLLEVH
jgi:hypothetical protein